MPPKIDLPVVIPSAAEYGYRGPVSQLGNGAQRALILALLQYLATNDELVQYETGGSAETEHSANIDHSIQIEKSLILAIEEPELYLHPSRCRYFHTVLKRLQQKTKTQIAITTHSPYFVDLDQYADVRILRRQQNEHGRSEVIVEHASSARIEAEWRRIWNKKAEVPFEAEHYLFKIKSVLTEKATEAFFAKIAVIVEGETEKGIIAAINENRGTDWDQKDIAVVPAQGKSNIEKLLVIFSCLGIPVYIIWDGDIHNKCDEPEKASKTDCEKSSNSKLWNRTLQNAASVSTINDWPSTQVQVQWAVFEDRIEDELLATTRDSDDEMRREIASKLGSASLKNAMVAFRYVEKLYANGKSFPVFEKIIEQVELLL